MKLLDFDIAPLGMGCWQVGGQMFSGDMSVGYSRTDDTASRATTAAALDAGIRLFDTAPAYGAGHSERLLGEALKGRDDVAVVTKFGLDIDEASRQITGENTDPSTVTAQIDASLKRLQRDRVDVLLLHLNSLDPALALPLFEAAEAAREAGKVGTYGWSTDYTKNLTSLDGLPGVGAVEHATNVFFDPIQLRREIEARRLTAFIRSPLAMGLLGGRFDAGSTLPNDDVRASGQAWIAYFKEGRPNPDFLSKLGAIRELLQTGGRSLTQGAIGWLWAKSDLNVPVPGARSPDQIRDTAGAIEFGALDQSVMDEIETLIEREDPGEERDR